MVRGATTRSGDSPDAGPRVREPLDDSLRPLLYGLGACQQASRLDEIIKRGTLRVGMTGDYLPFSSFDKATSKFRGFDVDMAEALGKALGVKVEYRARPPGRS